jgi:hypothetical protein
MNWLASILAWLVKPDIMHRAKPSPHPTELGIACRFHKGR